MNRLLGLVRSGLPGVSLKPFRRQLSWAAAIMLATTGLIGLVGFAAPAQASTYTISSYERCLNYVNGLNGKYYCVRIQVHTTNTSSQIWINGSTSAYYSGEAPKITWSGLGGGNGTGKLNVGINWSWPGLSGSFWMRLYIPASGGCSTSAYNANVAGASWFNPAGGITCKAAA